nr:MAG TPA: hypothetical protein [Caudoviricetes sp.]
MTLWLLFLIYLLIQFFSLSAKIESSDSCVNGSKLLWYLLAPNQ